MFAKRLGKLKKGGVPDVLAAAKIVLQDWNTGKISFYTHPPERKSTEHDSAQVMQYFGAEFDLKALEKEEKDDLDGLLSAMDSALVLGPGKPTDMEDVQVEEEVEDEDVEEDGEEEEDAMVDSDGEETPSASVVQMLVKQKTNTVKEVGDKKVILTEDMSNQQVNRNKKKAFKSQQKEERKKMSRLVAAEENAMKVDEENVANGGDGGGVKFVNDDQTSMADSDDDSYNFNELILK